MLSKLFLVAFKAFNVKIRFILVAHTQVTLFVKTSPSAFVGITAVDWSAQLMRDDSATTRRDRFFEVLDSFEVAEAEVTSSSRSKRSLVAAAPRDSTAQSREWISFVLFEIETRWLEMSFWRGKFSTGYFCES